MQIKTKYDNVICVDEKKLKYSITNDRGWWIGYIVNYENRVSLKISVGFFDATYISIPELADILDIMREIEKEGK